MIVLEVGRTYSTKEIIEALEVSQSTWDHRRNELLSNLGNYYEYEVIYEGRRKFYKIVNQLGDYEKPPNKRSAEKRNAIYEEEIIEVIDADPIQTAKNVSRIIYEQPSIKAFNHTEGTVYEYTRRNMITMFGNGKSIPSGTKGEIVEKIWCRLNLKLNMYEEMSPEAIENFKVILKDKRQKDIEYEAEIMADYQNRLISKEEMRKLIADSSYIGYVGAQRLFRDRYGYIPLRVPVYSIFEKDLINFENMAA